jgi:hypothetical protein
MENKTDCLIAKWLSEILKPDEDEKVGVYTKAFWEAWGKPPEPQNDDLSENEHQDKGRE